MANIEVLYASNQKTNHKSNRENKLNNVQIDELNLKALNSLKENYKEALNSAGTARLYALNNKYTEGVFFSEIIQSLVYINTNRAKEAFNILSNVKAPLSKLNDAKLKSKMYDAFGQYYYNIGQYDSAQVYFKEGLNYIKSSADFKDSVNAFVSLGKTAIKKGNLNDARFFHEKAAKIIFAHNLNQIARNQDLLGELFHAQKLFHRALISYYDALKTNRKNNDVQLNAGINLHLGNSYYMLVKDDSAQHYYAKALQNFKQLGDSNGIAICFSNLSRVYLEAGKHETAIAYALKAIHTIHDGNYKPVELGTLQQLGDIYGALSDFKKAEFYLKKALTIAEQHNQKMAETDCIKSLSEIYEMQGKHNLSYNYLIKAYHLKDSLQPLSFNRQLAEMQTKFETEKKEKEIAKLSQLKIKNQLKLTEQTLAVQKRNYIIAGVLIFILLLSISGVILFKQQKLKQNKINEHNLLTQQNEERQRIAKDLHDEIGSGLSKIALLSALSSTGNEINQHYALKTINSTAQNVIDNMRDLIWTLKSENHTIERLATHLREYAAKYLEEFPIDLTLNFQENFSVPISISKEIQHHILMCYKEALNNIVKHANASSVTIHLSMQNGLFQLIIADNGIGMKELGKSEKGHHGMINMKNRMEAIGGTVDIETEENAGTRVTVNLPLT